MEWLIGVIGLILWIYALVKIIGSSASTGAKILWALLVFFLPVIGFIIWFFAGPK